MAELKKENAKDSELFIGYQVRKDKLRMFVHSK